LKLPEDQRKLVSLKDVAVIIMAYLEQMADNYVSSRGLYKVQLLITNNINIQAGTNAYNTVDGAEPVCQLTPQ